MKKLLYFFVSVLVVTSCSSPKYTYNFDYYDYNSGKKKPVLKETVASAKESPLTVDESTIVASAKEDVVYEPQAAVAPVSKAEAVAKLKSMTKADRKELKAELKKYAKESKKSSSVKEGQGTMGLGGDLKLAAIFGAIGIVLLIIGGDALSLIGGISLLVGLFFLIRYLINQ